VNREYYKEAGKPWIISAHIAAKALSPIQELKIKNIVTTKTVRRPGVINGTGRNWLKTEITGITKDGARKTGSSSIPAITRSIEPSIRDM